MEKKKLFVIIRLLGFLLSLSLVFSGTVFLISSVIGLNVGVKEMALSIRLTLILGFTILLVGLIGLITFHMVFESEEEKKKRRKEKLGLSSL